MFEKCCLFKSLKGINRQEVTDKLTNITDNVSAAGDEIITRLNEILAQTKLNDLRAQRRVEELETRKPSRSDSTHPIILGLAAIGAVAVVASISYAVYRIVCPDYLEEYDEFEDIEDADDEEELKDRK